ncbi:MAG: DUF4340 domain-containing protein [Bacteroidetes bacterium]|nr:MAG: DUF4340 domain-containing protein [Bacteroidota bacterium]
MFRKINIKILATIFAALLALVILVEFMDARKGNRTFKTNLVEVAVEEITSVEIYPKTTNGAMIKLFRENGLWKVESEGKKYNADQSTPGRLIAELNSLKTKNVAATKKENWENFEVTDSLGTRVKLIAGTKVLSELIIGKFSFSEPRNTTSYVRMEGEKEVYGVEGLLSMSFNRNLNAFRDRTVINSTKTDWTKLTFSYPADSSFVLEKKAEKWMIGELETDSAAVAQYFNTIASLTDGNFAAQKPEIAPTHRLIIEGNNGMQKIEISGYFVSPDEFVLESNQNPDTWLNSKTTADKLFVSSFKLIQN